MSKSDDQAAIRKAIRLVLEARNELLQQGFVRGNSRRVRSAFFDLFPATRELSRELESSLGDLREGEAPARKKAAKYIEAQSRKSKTVPLEMWLKDPRTVEVLVAAVDDSDEEVVINVALALGNIASRYQFPAPEAFDALETMYADAPATTKIVLAIAIAPFPNQAKWTLLVDALRGGASGKRNKWLPLLLDRLRSAGRPDRNTSAAFAELLSPILDSAKGADRVRIVAALGRVGDVSSLDRLKALKVPKKDAQLKEATAQAVRELSEALAEE